MTKIKCSSVEYRKGFIEVLSGIHENCINIEAWNIHPDTKMDSFNEIDEESFTGNIELELNTEEVEYLIKLLQEAIRVKV